MDYVIGSGPTAMACALALLQRGRRVRLLDGGVRLEYDRQRLVDQLAATPPDDWDPAVLRRLKGELEPSTAGIPEKQLFGSNYPYRDADAELGLRRQGIGLQASLAQGGLSTVWGSAMLPSREVDLVDWPFGNDELVPHYQAALELCRLAGVPDGLDRLFPLFTGVPGRLDLSRQAAAMLGVMDRHRETLEAAGVHHGRSRIAVQAASENHPGCVHCGFCMYGCPYGYIYNSIKSLESLHRLGDIDYQPDVIVTTVSENNGGVVVRGHQRQTRQSLEFEGQNVFLAAGVLPTTRILLGSLGAYDQPVQMLDSQYFLLPVILRRRVPGVREERLHALSQLFIELLDPAVSPHTVHLQVYSYNDLIGRAVRGLFGPFARLLDGVVRELEGRLLLVQGFVHSKHSSRIIGTLTRSPDGQDLFQVRPEIHPEARETVRKVVRKLSRVSRSLGVWPVSPMLKVAEPGRSFHVGGSFPMRLNPAGFASDSLGRPSGWKRIHAVDASVFPSVPATTITLTAMANAHRIGAKTNP